MMLLEVVILSGFMSISSVTILLWLGSWILLGSLHKCNHWLFTCTYLTSHKGQCRGALIFSLICTRINRWVNKGKAGDLRCHRAHYDVAVMPPHDHHDHALAYFQCGWSHFVIVVKSTTSCWWNLCHACTSDDDIRYGYILVVKN